VFERCELLVCKGPRARREGLLLTVE
jgi:hypothetical protein